ncbi:MAG TPA: hypothetical protein VNT32_11765 [Thermoleophilaceae bacterium]|nr:hypothetical protein [Thermoleophilaceae bacterium]
MTALGAFASRLGRNSLVLGASVALQLLFGLAIAAFLTHHLPPAEYGQLALYLLVPSLFMVVSNLALLQGTVRVIFGRAGEEEAFGDVEDENVEIPEDLDVRVALFTGMVLTLLVSAILTGVVAIFAADLADLLGSREEGVTLVWIGVASGTVGAQWRLVSNVLRYAQRPLAFGATQAAQVAFALVATVILVLRDADVEAAILGFGIGTTGALVLTLVLARRDFKVGFDRRIALLIPKQGAAWAPVSLSYHGAQTLDVLAVSLIASKADAGLYRLASNLARGATYGVQVFLYSWGPLLQTPLGRAVDRERGRQQTAATVIGTYAVAASFVVLVFGVAADVLVRIAPASFGDAAGLVPLIALAPICRGWLATIYTSVEFKSKRKFFVVFATSVLALAVAFWATLGQILGPYGVALGTTLAFLLPALVMLLLAQRGPKPVPHSPRRLVLAPAMAAGLLLGELAIDPPENVAGLALKLAFVLAFPVLLVVTGTVPRAVVLALLRPLRLLRYGRDSRDLLLRRIGTLDAADRALVYEFARGRPVERIAGERGARPDDVLASIARVTARVAAVEGAFGASVGRYLTFVGAAGARALFARELIDEGVEPMALDRLDQTARRLRRLGRRRPSRSGSGDGQVVWRGHVLD